MVYGKQSEAGITEEAEKKKTRGREERTSNLKEDDDLGKGNEAVTKSKTEETGEESKRIGNLGG